MVEITLYRKQNDVAFGGTSPTCLYSPGDIVFFPDNFSKLVLQKISFMYVPCNRAPSDVLETSKGKNFVRYKIKQLCFLEFTLWVENLWPHKLTAHEWL